ncbi:MAG: DNA-processing protein DprA [Acidimicrobiales bacterium]
MTGRAGADTHAVPEPEAEPDAERLACLVALCGLPGIGPATLLRVAVEADPVEVWDRVGRGRAGGVPALDGALGPNPGERSRRAAAMTRAAAGIVPGQELARHRANGRSVLALGSPEYPLRLFDDPEPPALLFAEGHLEAFADPSVAMVGTRNATRAGRELAAELAAGLARSGVAVVSGLALGIDGAAHAGALTVSRDDQVGSGRPIGVIASGLDIAYPRRHQQLHRDIVRHGLLVSETPLGQRPTAWRFPARNRIIAGLADAVVIVESRSAGGSMLTAAAGLARDRPVLAVPGHPTAPAAAGANDLIFDGASPVRDLEDILVAIGRGGTSVAPARGGPPAAEHDPLRRKVLSAFGVDPLSLDEVVDRTGLTLTAVASALVDLEALGAVVRSGSWFERAGPPGPPDLRRRSGR